MIENSFKGRQEKEKEKTRTSGDRTRTDQAQDKMTDLNPAMLIILHRKGETKYSNKKAKVKFLTEEKK